MTQIQHAIGPGLVQINNNPLAKNDDRSLHESVLGIETLRYHYECEVSYFKDKFQQGASQTRISIIYIYIYVFYR
jgi:hypothetical protein